MSERLQQEIQLVEAQYRDIEVDPEYKWLKVNSWKLADGWNKDEITVLVFVPSGYPVTPPDNFLTDHDLRLVGEGMPAATSANQAQLGQQWVQFSYHVEGGEWKPHENIVDGHNLLTFLSGVEKRLSEAS